MAMNDSCTAMQATSATAARKPLATRNVTIAKTAKLSSELS